MDWTLFEKGVFLVNLLGIIYNPDTKMIFDREAREWP